MNSPQAVDRRERQAKREDFNRSRCRINNDDSDNDDNKIVRNDASIDVTPQPHSSSSWLSSYPYDYDCSSNENVCPIRMTLIQATQQQFIGLVRIMGVVVTKPDLVKTTVSFSSTDLPNEMDSEEEEEEKEALSFLFDDGTAMMDVLYYNKKNIATWHHKLVKGQTIDLVGVLEPLITKNNTKSNNDSGVTDSSTTTTNIPTTSSNKCAVPSEVVCHCLVAHTISKVPHPDSETLRFLELLSTHIPQSSNSRVCSLEKNPTRNYYYRDDIMFAGDSVVSSRLGFFQQSSDPTTHNHNGKRKRDERSSVQINTTDAFRFLEYNDRENGTSKDDLMILFGCTTNEEQQAVIDVLDQLQANGEIYKNNANGLYLPL